MVALPEGYKRDKRGRLYNAGARRFASAADAEALGVPLHVRPVRATAPVADVTLDPTTIPKRAGRPKKPKHRAPAETDDEPKPKTSSRKEDENDLTELIAQLYYALGALTQFPGWRLQSESEARSIARPAQRILARHRSVERYVRQFSDPAALVFAVVSVTLVRYVMWRQWRAAGSPAIAEPAIGSDWAPAEPPPMTTPPPPPSNGAVTEDVGDLLERLRNVAGS